MPANSALFNKLFWKTPPETGLKCVKWRSHSTPIEAEKIVIGHVATSDLLVWKKERRDIRWVIHILCCMDQTFAPLLRSGLQKHPMQKKIKTN